MPESLPFAWFEKISLLLLALHLESHGFSRTLLSVPPGELPEGAGPHGTDWARAFKAAKEHPGAFGKGQGRARRAAYASTIVTPAERLELAALLRPSLRDWVATDRAYRYDGIWHDDGGNVDLVAWGPAGALLVEAKGISKREGRINWQTAACDTLAVVDRVVGSDKAPLAGRGLLLPDDRGIGPAGGGFVGTLLRVWPRDRAED